MKRPGAVLDAAFIMARVSAQPTGCWHWTGCVNKALGRGTYNGKYAYRIAYEVLVGPIPAGLQINHHCDNGLCVNPDHLYAGSQQQNIRDAIDRNRLRVPKSSRGEANHHAFPDAVVDEIRARYMAGEMQKDLAAEFGISVSCIRIWVSGGARGREPIKRKPGVCGTRSGYAGHIRRKEATCGPCRDANTTYLRAYKAARYSALRSAA